MIDGVMDAIDWLSSPGIEDVGESDVMLLGA